MNKLALGAIILLAGCAAAKTRIPGADPKLTGLEEERQTIAEREQKCIDNTLTRNRDEVARIAATSDSPVELLIQRAKNERDRELSQCRIEADAENAQISARERSEYDLQAQQERDNAARMMILTTSGPR